MKLMPYTSFFLGYPIMHLRVNPTVVFLVGMWQLNDLTGLKSLEFVFAGDFWTDSTMVNHPFSSPFGNYDLFCSKASWPFANQRQRDWYISQKWPLMPPIGFQRSLGGKKQIRPQQNLHQKTWNFSRCLEVQWIFFCNLQEVNSQWFW